MKKASGNKADGKTDVADDEFSAADFKRTWR